MAIQALGCAHAPPSNFSETWVFCERQCAAEGRTIQRCIETPDAIAWTCGRRVPDVALLKHNNYEVPRFIQRRPWTRKARA